MIFLYILVAILVLMFMITVHELGHYLAAKVLRFKVNEFAIGFGKPLLKYKRKNGEIFSIRAIPLGGFCSFATEQEDEAGAPGASPYEKDPTAIPFEKMAPWKRLVVLFSGAFANFICGIIFCLILIASIGYYQQVEVRGIDPASHNAAVVMQGDVITEINGTPFTIMNNFQGQLAQFDVGETFYLTIYNNGVRRDNVPVSRDEIIPASGERYIGLGFRQGDLYASFQDISFGASIGYSFVLAWDLALMVLRALWQMVTFQISLSNMGGTFSTIAVMSDVVSMGMINLLILIPLISINLAVFNLLPVPALDGARMVFVFIEWIRGRPVDPNLENKIHMIGLFCLLGFVLLLDLNFLIFQNLFR